MQIIKEWFRRHFSNPQVVFLALLLLGGLLVVIFFGNMLAPALAALVIAYLLDGLVVRLENHQMPRLAAVLVVYCFFIVSFFLLLLVLIPNVVQQTRAFVINDLPGIVKKVTGEMQVLNEKYEKFKKESILSMFEKDEGEGVDLELMSVANPDEMPAQGTNIVYVAKDSRGQLYFRSFDAEGRRIANKPETALLSENERLETLKDELAGLWDKEELTPEEKRGVMNAVASIPGLIPEKEGEEENDQLFNIDQIAKDLEGNIKDLGTRVLAFSMGSIVNVVGFLIYLVLVPVLVFFLLKDKQRIIQWFSRFLPKDRSLAAQVWREVNLQTSNYIRGKFWEIIIVWSVTHVTFTLFDLKSRLILSLLVGLSVLVPYIGAIVMTIPIGLIAFYQYGGESTSTVIWILVVYGIIQTLDGNVLAPILLSEVTNLHPIAVIVAILVFGGIWGFWGVFFAIPLATLVNAVLNAWPKELPAAAENQERKTATPEEAGASN